MRSGAAGRSRATRLSGQAAVRPACSRFRTPTPIRSNLRGCAISVGRPIWSITRMISSSSRENLAKIITSVPRGDDEVRPIDSQTDASAHRVPAGVSRGALFRGRGTVRVHAVVADLMAELGAPLWSEKVFDKMIAREPAQRNWQRLLLIGAWLLFDPWFREHDGLEDGLWFEPAFR